MKLHITQEELRPSRLHDYYKSTTIKESESKEFHYSDRIEITLSESELKEEIDKIVPKNTSQRIRDEICSNFRHSQISGRLRKEDVLKIRQDLLDKVLVPSRLTEPIFSSHTKIYKKRSKDGTLDVLQGELKKSTGTLKDPTAFAGTIQGKILDINPTTIKYLTEPDWEKAEGQINAAINLQHLLTITGKKKGPITVDQGNLIVCKSRDNALQVLLQTSNNRRILQTIPLAKGEDINLINEGVFEPNAKVAELLRGKKLSDFQILANITDNWKFMKRATSDYITEEDEIRNVKFSGNVIREFLYGTQDRTKTQNKSRKSSNSQGKNKNQPKEKSKSRNGSSQKKKD